MSNPIQRRGLVDQWERHTTSGAVATSAAAIASVAAGGNLKAIEQVVVHNTTAGALDFTLQLDKSPAGSAVQIGFGEIAAGGLAYYPASGNCKDLCYLESGDSLLGLAEGAGLVATVNYREEK